MQYLGKVMSRSRTAPRGYEQVRWVFHGIRTAQLVAAILVGGILSAFLHYLNVGHHSIPWTFLFLLIVSFLTVTSLLVTIVIHFLTGLTPRLNLVLNTILLSIWLPSYISLSYWMWTTLTHQCTPNGKWHSLVGMRICQTYKALFTFALLGTLSTIAALVLDWRIHSQVVQQGRHFPLSDIDDKSQATGQAALVNEDWLRPPNAERVGLTSPSPAASMPSSPYRSEFGLDTAYNGRDTEGGLDRRV